MNTQEWLAAEREYADEKRGEMRQRDIDDLNVHDHDLSNTVWWVDTEDRIHRASQLGLDNPEGRRQLGKAVVIMLGMLDAAVELYGELET